MLRSLLAKTVQLRTTPKLKFHYDVSVDRGRELSALIDKALAGEEVVTVVYGSRLNPAERQEIGLLLGLFFLGVGMSLDLAVVAALTSSYNDIPVSGKTAFAAEIGLSGEVRAVSRIEQRISEADKLGFEKIFISKFNQKIDTKKYNLEIVALSKVQQLMEGLFG